MRFLARRWYLPLWVAIVGAMTLVSSVEPTQAQSETFIHQIQGSGSTVTNSGSTVTVEAIVVADFQGSDELSGFFIQEESSDEDGDVATSEGIFVYCDLCPVDVQEGNQVQLTGFQIEFHGMSQINVTAPSHSVIVVDSGNNLDRVTPVKIDLPVPDSFTNPDEYFEQFEGMLVEFIDELTVTEYFQLGRYGQIVLAEGGRLRQFTHLYPPSAAGLQDHLDDVARRKVIVDDTNNRQNGDFVYHPSPGFSRDNFVRGGDTVTGLRGVLHYSWAGQSGTDAFRLRPTEAFPITFTPATTRDPAPTVNGNVTVASFNVLNYFTTLDTGGTGCGPTGNLECRGANSTVELERQTAKIVAAMSQLDADIVGLMEIENNSSASLQALVDALNGTMGGNTYSFINTGTLGTDAIKVGLIYKPTVVTPFGSHAALDSDAFVDPNNIGSAKNRPALAQTFEITQSGNPSQGAVFTVIVNHFKSKGSNCGPGDDDTTTGQGNCNSTRTGASQALLNWLATDPTDTAATLGSPDTDFLITGDLNAYALEDPITTLTGAGYANLTRRFLGDDAYSFVFDGQWGYLDHALSSASLTPQIVGVAEWHINADEVNLLDYNDTVQDPGEAAFMVKPTATELYRADAYRASDHDPLIVGLAPLAGNAAFGQQVFLPAISVR